MKEFLSEKNLGRNYSVIVVSEGAKPLDKNLSVTRENISQFIANKLAKEVHMNTRVTVLGHLQRRYTQLIGPAFSYSARCLCC